jgi:hypothetical protein
MTGPLQVNTWVLILIVVMSAVVHWFERSRKALTGSQKGEKHVPPPLLEQKTKRTEKEE